MVKVQNKINEAKSSEEEFRKVIKQSDPKQLSFGSVDKELEYRSIIREQSAQIEELKRKIEGLNTTSLNNEN